MFRMLQATGSSFGTARSAMNSSADAGEQQKVACSCRFPLEQAGGHEQQHDDQDREADRDFVIGGQKLQQTVRRQPFGGTR